MNFNSPSEIANSYVAVGKCKANLPLVKAFILAMLAGAYIALAGVGSTAASATIENASTAKFVSACVFPAGLAMVIVSGSELFTGNCLLIIPLMEKEISLAKMLRSWLVVYLGNFTGSVLVSAVTVFSHQPSLYGGAMAAAMLSAANAKCALSFGDAFLKGIACNFLVCLAVWMAFASKDIAGKIIALFFPIMIFVVCGFEHSIANMYYITAGLFVKLCPAYASLGAGCDALTVGGLFSNLIPVTLGNIVGGALCLGLPYWFVYVKKK